MVVSTESSGISPLVRKAFDHGVFVLSWALLVYAMYSRVDMVRFYKGRRALHAVLFAAIPGVVARFLPWPTDDSYRLYEAFFYVFQAYALRCVSVFLAACQADEGAVKYEARWCLYYHFIPHVDWTKRVTKREKRALRLGSYIYLDHNATTPLSDGVKRKLAGKGLDLWGNPGSAGSPFAENAQRAIEACKTELAQLIRCDESQLIITSGGTESNHTAIRTAFEGVTKGRCITTAFEHPAIDEPLAAMKDVVEQIRVPVDHKTGQVDEKRFVEELHKGATLVSIMWANNEVGAVQNIGRLVELTRKHCPAAMFHTDASQAVGKVPVYAGEVDFLTIAGHKFYAPKAIGALYVRSGSVTPLLYGGSQQGGRRAGTESAMLCVALGKAAAEARLNLTANMETMRHTRDLLWKGISDRFPRAKRWSGTGPDTLPNTLSCCLDPESPLARDLVVKCAELKLLFSAGAACHSGSMTPSKSLVALGIDEKLCLRTLRLTTGVSTTVAEIERAVAILGEAYDDLSRKEKKKKK